MPVFRRVNLTVEADRRDYEGSVYVELRADSEVESFRFHAEGLTITHLLLRQAGHELEAGYAVTDSVHVTVLPTGALTPGDYTLEIDFTNTFDTQAVSLYRMEVDGQGYTFTQFEEDDAREAFPCWDEPSFKFPYQVILTVPEAHADRILRWMFSNYEMIMARIPPVYKAYIPYFAGGCSRQRPHRLFLQSPNLRGPESRSRWPGSRTP